MDSQYVATTPGLAPGHVSLPHLDLAHQRQLPRFRRLHGRHVERWRYWGVDFRAGERFPRRQRECTPQAAAMAWRGGLPLHRTPVQTQYLLLRNRARVRCLLPSTGCHMPWAIHWRARRGLFAARRDRASELHEHRPRMSDAQLQCLDQTVPPRRKTVACLTPHRGLTALPAVLY